ncbi:sigma-70 family RNA polymerase sigma factor [Marinobacter orientalis]|uniref:Sigma-70 family RNA polymerase sigma factor n=1 Tax=Marinobacter orientalis TaxID=1928859 RepID=A0A7Y0WS29_9GAMM|nr:sigma-70 family RNA polymerase sigma factor [Marinobacter orientalis]NMT63475.1 sigma-70 family RNA polymerase sigma factor [Marinobacter orientalis]TGX48536.1 sigma-70 family RNA polymerase sigma factor [Marinobacter orientalis]
MKSRINSAVFSKKDSDETINDLSDVQYSVIKPGNINHPSHNLLSPEEFTETWKAYKNGSVAARDKILLANQRLVMRFIRKQRNGHPDERDDLYQVGHLGLHHALKKYEPEKGAFSTYASRWIKSYIHEARAKSSSDVYIPQETRKFKNKVIRRVSQLQERGCDNPYEEAARELGKSVGQIKSVMALKKRSLQTPVAWSENSEHVQTLQDTLEDDRSSNLEAFAQNSQVSQIVKDLLGTALSEREARIMQLYFGLSAIDCNRSFAAVARQMDITRERVRQIYIEASAKLKALGGDVSVIEALEGIE